MPCMHIDHLYGFQSWGKHFIVCGNFRMEFVKINNSELLWMKYCIIWLKLSSALSIFEVQVLGQVFDWSTQLDFSQSSIIKWTEIMTAVL